LRTYDGKRMTIVGEERERERENKQEGKHVLSFAE
jgi:hypothetical protein